MIERVLDQYCRVRELTTTEVEQELVMLDLPRGKYYGLNPVATAVWKTLDSPIDLDQICISLLTQFDVDEASCRTEVDAFLSQLYAAGLVTKTGEKSI